MVHKVICLAIILLLLLTSCVSYERYPGSGHAVASWYGSEFHGRPTSSGEVFDMYAFTCAHREYPFGTRLRITNISNNMTVQCLVNDRGPFVDGRDVDLSYASAREIGLLNTGIASVRIEYLGRDNSYVKPVRYVSDEGPFTVQIGSFSEIENAIRLKAALELKYTNVYITKGMVGGSVYYRVRIGKYFLKDEVSKLAGTIANEGYTALITRYDGKI